MNRKINRKIGIFRTTLSENFCFSYKDKDLLKDSLIVSRTRRETGALVKATKVSYMYPRILILWNSDSSFERERYRNTENKVQNRELQDWPTFIWNQKPIHVGSVAVTLRRFGETRTCAMSQTIHDSSRNASEIHECFKFAKEFINLFLKNLLIILTM